ncbi:MAG: hypothetical protein GY765_39065 [bacterium]|nr:hypothetical protein [bacterium]
MKKIPGIIVVNNLPAAATKHDKVVVSWKNALGDIKGEKKITRTEETTVTPEAGDYVDIFIDNVKHELPACPITIPSETDTDYTFFHGKVDHIKISHSKKELTIKIPRAHPTWVLRIPHPDTGNRRQQKDQKDKDTTILQKTNVTVGDG